MPVDRIADASAGGAGIGIALEMPTPVGTDVPFVTAGKKLKDFALDVDDRDPTLSDSRTFTKLKAGTYVIQQQPVARLSLSAIVCSSGNGTDNKQARCRSQSGWPPIRGPATR